MSDMSIRSGAQVIALHEERSGCDPQAWHDGGGPGLVMCNTYLGGCGLMLQRKMIGAWDLIAFPGEPERHPAVVALLLEKLPQRDPLGRRAERRRARQRLTGFYVDVRIAERLNEKDLN